MNSLIIGYGRAGRRHGRILDELGIQWAFYDPSPAPPVDFQDALSPRCLRDTLAEALQGRDFAVIATPPDLHLSQIRQCLDAGLPVLCEKPLCGLGQLAAAEALLQHPNADKVMVAYNYRYHPKLIAAKGKVPKAMICRQNRQVPAWGLLLDHCSHDLDILRSVCPQGASGSGPLTVARAQHIRYSDGEDWIISLEAQGQPLVIRERVGVYPERVAVLIYQDAPPLDIDPDPAMFGEMWAAFLRGDYAPGLAEAIETQRLLEKCKELAE